MSFFCFDIEFRISYIFLAFVVLFLAVDHTGLYAPMLLSVLLHEAAHIAAILMCKAKIETVRLTVGAIEINYNDGIPKLKRIICLLSGPVANLIAAAVFLLFKNEVYFAVNTVIGIYNLLPIKNLDGGSIVEALLEGMVSEKIIKLILCLTTALTMAIFALVLAVCSPPLEPNYSFLLFAVYLITPLFLKKFVETD